LLDRTARRSGPALDAHRPTIPLVSGKAMDCVEQLVQPLAEAGTRGHNGDAQLLGQNEVINRQFVSFCLIHEVQANDNSVSDSEYLQHEIEIVMQTGGVDHNHRHVWLPE
jgi:hypothetical protein